MHGRRLLNAFFVLFLTLLATAAPRAEEDFLLPDQAFRISGAADGPDAVVVSWDVEDGYYLYRSKFKFRSKTVGIEPRSPSVPTGEAREDEFFGTVQILRGRVDVRLPVRRGESSDDILTLEATSQGCADAGLCYPPHKQTILLELPKLSAAAPAPDPRSKAAAGRVTDPAPEPNGDTPPPAEVDQPALRALTDLNQSLGLGGMEDDFLPAEEAFKFHAEVTGPERIRLTWTIAEETYLYLEKLAVSLEDSRDVAIGALEYPEAEIKKDAVRPDGSIGDVAVYHRLIDFEVPLLRGTSAPTSVTLVAKYQGCAERGICYPPQTAEVKLDLPAAATVTELPGKTAGALPVQKPAAQATAPVSEQDRIAAVLAGGSLWAAVALFFGFGLLLAFTPCVFPMIPILSGIIAGHGPDITTGKAFRMSLVYVLAMALTYALVGLLAGLGGANLQAAFQNPWVLTVFALVFVALALSMFGFYELQLPSSLQSKLTELSNRQQGGNLIGVAIMGALSALIVGPCVAPPLAGALIFIGQTGDAALGFAALFALGLGMGAPLVAIGTSAGKLLPRAGGWMDAVKAVFGVAMLGVAVVLLERILPAAVAMVLWALLLISSAVYMGALQPLATEASGWSKLWKGLGLALLVYGVLMLVGAAAGGKDTVQPLRGLAVGGAGGSAERHAAFKGIKTVTDLDREVAAAAAAGTPVMLDFYADWCVSCKEMERYTFSDPSVIAEMERFVLLQADVTANDEQDQALMQERFGIPGPPAILFFDADGNEQRGFRVVGFKPAAEFAGHLRRAAP